MNKKPKIHYGSEADLLRLESRDRKPRSISSIAKRMKRFDPTGKKALALAKKYRKKKKRTKAPSSRKRTGAVFIDRIFIRC